MMDSILAPLREVFFWFLRSSLEAGVIILLVLALQGVMRRRLSPRWHYWLWLILLARMALPWTPESPFSLFSVLPRFEPAALAGAPPVNAANVIDESGRPRLPIDANAFPTPTPESHGVAELMSRISPVDAAVLLWLAVALAFAAHVIVANAGLSRRARASRMLMDPATLQLFVECKDVMGVHTPVELSATESTGSPVLAGFLRPRLLLPRTLASQLTRDQLRFVLLHELAHVKRRDVLVSWMATALQAMHWFNPLVWYAFYRMRLDREMASDALVLSHLNEDKTREYGQTMLDLLVTVRRTRRVPGMAAILEDRSQMERRITMITFFRKSTYRWSISAAALLIAVSAVVLTGADSGTSDRESAKTDAASTLAQKVDLFDIDHGTLEDVIRTFGEPPRYRLGQETLSKSNLPDSFCLDYENGFMVWFQNRRLEELRFEGPEQDYAYQGKLRVGSSLEEALAVVGPPDQTIEGQANGWENGVLYKDISGHKGRGYYQRAERGIRMFFVGDKVAALYLTRRNSDAEEGSKGDSTTKPLAGADLTAKVEGFNINSAVLIDVLNTFGEALEYRWGNEKFDKGHPPDNFCMAYPDEFIVHMQKGVVQELRFHQPNFTLAGKLKVGSPLEDVIEFLGKPDQTVEGQANGWENGVLYKDINGRKGHCYYGREERALRFFFADYKVSGLYVTRRGFTASGGGFQQIRPVAVVNEYDDMRWKDMRRITFDDKPYILATLTFNNASLWPDTAPWDTGAPDAFMNKAKNPGLGVRALHARGITGKGVNVAIIDQPMYDDHPEFAGKIAWYHDVGCKSENSMHGPAVTSLLVGNECGTAPGANVYYVAAPSWLEDARYYAEALDQIVEQNSQLPARQKIRVASVSAAPNAWNNGPSWDEACARAQAAGILVLDCTSDPRRGIIGPCYLNMDAPEEVDKCMPGFPGMTPPSGYRQVLAPCSPRTTAEEYTKGKFAYQYTGRGGLSWGIPYAAGVLAMGWQLGPELTPEQMLVLLFDSVYVQKDGAPIINPRSFIDAVQQISVPNR